MLGIPITNKKCPRCKIQVYEAYQKGVCPNCAYMDNKKYNKNK